MPSSQSSSQYSEKHKKLLEMGFDAASITKALERTRGDLESATAHLLGEAVEPTAPAADLPPMQVVGKHTHSSSNVIKATASSKSDIKEAHNKFMATYKTLKCKDKGNHDKRMCIYWHTKSDRRRNPFEIMFSCQECPDSSETLNCPNGDMCAKAHNMLERMFHPELFKISMCGSAHCERGGSNLCAFAHSDEDHRVPTYHVLGKVTANSTYPIAGSSKEKEKEKEKDSSPTSKDKDKDTSSCGSGSKDSSSSNGSSDNNSDLQPSKTMSDSRMLDIIQEKLIRLIKSQGVDGIISSGMF